MKEMKVIRTIKKEFIFDIDYVLSNVVDEIEHEVAHELDSHSVFEKEVFDEMCVLVGRVVTDRLAEKYEG